MGIKVKKGDIPISMPEEFYQLILSWEASSKSPWTFSYYSVAPGEKDWGKTPVDCLRISDHWCYEVHGSLHSETDVPVKNKSHWTLARWNGDHYVVIASLPKQPWENLSKERASFLRNKIRSKYLKHMQKITRKLVDKVS